MTELLERLKTALADRYAVESEIGRGGMAVVFLAHDLKHDRKVAIKVFHPELAATLGAERLLREIEIGTKLTHPRVLSIFDSGEAAGILFYVMPYVTGESLRDRLNRETQLPLEEALEIAEQVADVLGYAHDQGIVHRDIKPENILFEAGHAIVADFGIAKAVATAGGQKLTQTGMAIGTPAYMSPEQASGEENVDGRADLYALGCVLYEMLAGEPPFTGATAQVILARKLTESVPGLRSARETVSEGLEMVIARTLAKAPADRYRNAREFADALRNPPRPAAGRTRRRWVLILGGVLVIVAGSWVVLQSSNADAVPVIAVLPCENLSPDSARIRAANRWTDDLITDLFNTPLLPRSWATMRRYRDVETSPAAIAAEQRADFFLTCGVDETGSEIQLRAALHLTENEDLLWTEDLRGDSTVAGMISVRSRAVRAIAEAAGASISETELEQLSSLPTQSDSAYQYYLRGRESFEEELEPLTSFASSLEYYDRAIAADSAFALAYLAKAHSLELHGQVASLAPKEYWPEVESLLIKALELDESLGMAHTLVAYARGSDDRSWPMAEYNFRRGIELEPRNAIAHTYYAQVLSYVGRHDEAIAHMKTAMDLEPTNTFNRSNLSWRYHFAGRYEDALHESRRAVEQDSTDALAWMTLGVNLAALGSYEEAISALEAGGSFAMPTLGWAYGRAGRRTEAEDLLEVLLQRASESYSDAVNISIIYAGLGDHDEAIAWLERAFEEESIYIGMALGDNEWIPLTLLRGDPRFQALRTRAGYAQ
jgi:serine/threonine-protein kinase